MIGSKDPKRIATNLMILTVGIFLSAIGAGCFVVPNGFLVGGATGLGKIISHFTGMPLSVGVWIISFALFLLGLIVLGKRYAATIILGTILYPLGLFVIEMFPQLYGLTEDKLLAAVFGALFMGLGSGMVLRIGGSVGGSDVVGTVCNRKFGWSTALVLNTFDCIILLTQCGFATVDEVLYGIMVELLFTVIVNQVLIMGSSDAQFFIISTRWKEINKKLQEDSVVGTTLLHGKSGYVGKEQEVIICTVHRREVRKVKDIILGIDEAAFITIGPTSDVSGRGFSLSDNYGVNEYLGDHEKKDEE